VVVEAADRLRDFRGEFFDCLGRQADELFELTDALLCAEGPVHTLSGCAWPRSIAAATALWMTHSTAARSMPSGCGDS
jgi:hypothetical protein